jgi:hypothetical protein
MNLYKKFKGIEEIKNYSSIIFKVICNYEMLNEITDGYKFVHVEKYQTNDNKIKILGECNITKKIIYITMEGHNNFSQLIDTWAHEISHIAILEHGKEHTKLKNAIKKLIKAYIDCNFENIAA